MVTYAKKIEKDPETARERIRHFRQHYEITQEEFATIIGCSRSNYANKENCGHGFSLDQLMKLGDYFDINMNWLFFGTGRMTRR